MSASDLIGSGETARLVGRSQKTLYRWIKAGRIKPAQVVPGGHVGTFLFKRTDVEQLVAELRETSEETRETSAA